MRKIFLIIVISLLYKPTINANTYNDIWELFHVYGAEDMEHHKKQGIQIICLYDCINNNFIESLSFKNDWDCNLDSIGIYSVTLATESNGIEFILLKIHEKYMVFLNIEPNKTKILRELIRISKEHSYFFTPKVMNNIMNNIINPKGSWISKQVLSPADTIGNLKLYFKLDSIRNKSIISTIKEQDNYLK